MEYVLKLVKNNKAGYRFVVSEGFVSGALLSLEIRESEKPFRVIVPSLVTKVQRSGKELVLPVPMLFITGGFLHRGVFYKIRVLPNALRGA